MSGITLTSKDVQIHLDGFNIERTKKGYLYGEEDDVLFLVEALREENSEGRWLVKFKDEISYVAPKLYGLLASNVHAYVNGQTLEDGTVMNRDKAAELSTAGCEEVKAPSKKETKRKRVEDSCNAIQENKKKRRRRATDNAFPVKLQDVAVRGGKLVQEKNYVRPQQQTKFVNTKITDEERDERETENRKYEDLFQEVPVLFYPEEGSPFSLQGEF
jgi:hypothetical protein